MTPYPQPYEDVPGLIPGNHRRKAGKPSYEQLERALCGQVGEMTVGKRRTITEEMDREYEAMGGVVIMEHGQMLVLSDRSAVIAHYQSS